MDKIKRAILIAAGQGSRLQPVTLQTPKPLVQVNKKRIMDTSIEALYVNGIEEIYIVVGYKKEQFYELYGNDKRIHLIENPYYLKGNNITSIYFAKDYLPESFVIEADIMIRDPDVLTPWITKSGYLASWLNKTTEWLLEVDGNNHIIKCEKDAEREGFQLWGISMWNKGDGQKLSEKIRQEFEKKHWSIYWDELALFQYIDEFDLGIRKIKENSLQEIDTFEELVSLDASYRDFGRNRLGSGMNCDLEKYIGDIGNDNA